MKKFFSALFFILIFSNFSFSQEIKEVVYKESYNYIPISYLTDTNTFGIFYPLIINEKGMISQNGEKEFVIFWYSMCTDGRYDLTITPEQIYLTSRHENPNPNYLFWVHPINNAIYQHILNGFQKNNIERWYFDSSYNEEKFLPIKIESIENEEYETWNWDNCDSLLEAQVDKFFLLMNEFIPNKSQKLDKTKCIFPKNPIFHSSFMQDFESWKNSIKKENAIEDEKILSKGIKRKFMFKEFNTGVEIYLREDFSFINFSYAYACTGGYRVKRVLGEYKINDNYITFMPKKMILEEDCCGHYFWKTKSFDTLDYYYSDSTKIQLNYWYIKKDSFEFLLSEAEFDELDEYFFKSSNFIALANLYTSNIEDDICYSVFCNIDTTINIRTILSKDDIPEKFQKLFLDEPIEAAIKSVKLNNERYPVYHLLSDRFDAIFIGMKFYSKDKFYPQIAIIDKKDDVLIAMGTDYFSDNNFYKYFGIKLIVKTRDKSKLKAGTILKTEKW